MVEEEEGLLKSWEEEERKSPEERDSGACRRKQDPNARTATESGFLLLAPLGVGIAPGERNESMNGEVRVGG